MRNRRKGRNKLDFNIEQLHKCTICTYASHSKSQFQRHLMKQHSIKLKNFETQTGKYATLGRVANNYNINLTLPDKTEEGLPKCNQCNEVFKDELDFNSHLEKCDPGLEAQTCRQCNARFKNISGLHKHLPICGKDKQIHCQLCLFKAFAGNIMTRHYIDKHNLICKFVSEPNFEQALNSAPYILERPVEVETLPAINDLDALQTASNANIGVGSTAKRRKPLWICPICKKEFTKERFLNRHRKLCL